MIRFDVSKIQMRTIQQIADRATAMARQHDKNYPTVEAAMDITAVHANGCPLQLERLLSRSTLRTTCLVSAAT